MREMGFEGVTCALHPLYGVLCVGFVGWVGVSLGQFKAGGACVWSGVQRQGVGL